MIVHVFVKPGRKREWLGWDGRQLVAHISAPPVEGAANERLVIVVAEWLMLSKSHVRVTKGWRSRNKAVTVETDELTVEDAISLLPRVPEQQPLL